MENRRRRFWMIPFVVIGIVLLLSGLVMALWNGVLTDVLAVKRISYGQAIGLFVLCKILFGSFRTGPRGGFYRGGQAWRTKLMNMTPEERERFKAVMKQRMGGKLNEEL